MVVGGLGGFRSFHVLVLTNLEHFLKPCVLCDYKEKEKTTLFEVI